MLVGKGATIQSDHASYRISTFSWSMLEYSKRGVHDDGASGKGTAFGTFFFDIWLDSQSLYKVSSLETGRLSNSEAYSTIRSYSSSVIPPHAVAVAYTNKVLCTAVRRDPLNK